MSSSESKGKDVATCADFIDLSQLSEGYAGAVKVMICRKWDSINSYGKYISSEYILSDDKGNAIQCSVRSNISHCFVGRLEEGQIFSLKNFSVIANKDKFRIRNTDRYLIELEGYTVARKIQCTPAGFDRHPFQITPFDAIELNDSTFLIDVIGYVVDIGKLRKTQKGIELLDCHIMNDRNARLRVTLWGSLCSDLINRKGQSDHYVSIFPCMNIKEFRGELYLSSTSATMLFDDKDIPHIASYLALIREGNNVAMFAMESHPEVEKGTIAKLLSVSKSLPDGAWNKKTSQSAAIQCRVCFVNVHTKNSWFYYACGLGNCKKRAIQRGNAFWCETCKKNSEFPRTSYRLHVEVVDETGTAIVTLFDNIVEELLEKKAKELLAEVGDDADQNVLPQPILALIKTCHTLEIKSNKNNSYESFTANKLIHQTPHNEAPKKALTDMDDGNSTMKTQTNAALVIDDSSAHAALSTADKLIRSAPNTEGPNKPSSEAVDADRTNKRQRDGAIKIADAVTHATLTTGYTDTGNALSSTDGI